MNQPLSLYYSIYYVLMINFRLIKIGDIILNLIPSHLDEQSPRVVRSESNKSNNINESC